ncbi:MAG: ABC transporter permease, partial [Actinomycetota bacterium]
RGVMTLYVLTSGLLSGHLLPVHWFPGWLAAVAHATPFPSIIQAPIDVVTGRAHGLAAATVIGIQVAWLAVLLGAGRLVFAAGARKLVVQGG